MVVVGDTHGQFLDVLSMLNITNAYAGGKCYIFNGAVLAVHYECSGLLRCLLQLLPHMLLPCFTSSPYKAATTSYRLLVHESASPQICRPKGALPAKVVHPTW